MTAEAQALVGHLQRMVADLCGLLVQAERDQHETALALHTLRLACSEVENRVRAVEELVSA